LPSARGRPPCSEGGARSTLRFSASSGLETVVSSSTDRRIGTVVSTDPFRLRRRSLTVRHRGLTGTAVQPTRRHMADRFRTIFDLAWTFLRSRLMDPARSLPTSARSLTVTSLPPARRWPRALIHASLLSEPSTLHAHRRDDRCDGHGSEAFTHVGQSAPYRIVDASTCSQPPGRPVEQAGCADG
jgi:hypothetical protein